MAIHGYKTIRLPKCCYTCEHACIVEPDSVDASAGGWYCIKFNDPIDVNGLCPAYEQGETVNLQS